MKSVGSAAFDRMENLEKRLHVQKGKLTAEFNSVLSETCKTYNLDDVQHRAETLLANFSDGEAVYVDRVSRK